MAPDCIFSVLALTNIMPTDDLVMQGARASLVIRCHGTICSWTFFLISLVQYKSCLLFYLLWLVKDHHISIFLLDVYCQAHRMGHGHYLNLKWILMDGCLMNILFFWRVGFLIVKCAFRWTTKMHLVLIGRVKPIAWWCQIWWLSWPISTGHVNEKNFMSAGPTE